MRYKGDYRPSELLCPETYCWVPLTSCLDVFRKTKYSRLFIDQSEEKKEEDCSLPSHADPEILRLLVGVPFPVTLSQLTEEGQKILQPVLSEFCTLISEKTARQCMIRLR
mmetsp:Transcript_37360/g.47637  ORF Transcript_37360/g.47637 Transcript_37360/m.47637 type:complete len:110 (+) Transcript_37360:1-330(+)